MNKLQKNEFDLEAEKMMRSQYQQEVRNLERQIKETVLSVPA